MYHRYNITMPFNIVSTSCHRTTFGASSKCLPDVVVPEAVMIRGGPDGRTSLRHRRMPFIICYSDLGRCKGAMHAPNQSGYGKEW